jgi:hypothetical protein
MTLWALGFEPASSSVSIALPQGHAPTPTSDAQQLPHSVENLVTRVQQS